MPSQTITARQLTTAHIGRTITVPSWTGGTTTGVLRAAPTEVRHGTLLIECTHNIYWGNPDAESVPADATITLTGDPS